MWPAVWVWLAVTFVAASSAGAQSVPAYSLLRENEDWSFLRDTSLRQDIWDPLKYVRLGSDDWYLTIGGEVREVVEQVGNDNWGKQRYTNTFFLERDVLNRGFVGGTPYMNKIRGLTYGVQVEINGSAQL